MLMTLAAQSMSTTATHFSVKAKDGKARCGILKTKNGSIDTPAVLLYTRRGGPLNLTSPDMLAAVTPPVQGVQLNTMHFLENPDARVLGEFGRGAHGFLCLEGLPILASNRDPTMYEYGTRPSSDKELHVSIHSGGHMVSPERFMATVAALRPDLYVSLCDEVPADAKPKRIATSTNRTTAWLKACLRLHDAYQHYPAQQQQQQSPPPLEQQEQQQNQDASGGKAEAAMKAAEAEQGTAAHHNQPQPAGLSNNGNSRSSNGCVDDETGGGDDGGDGSGLGPLSGSLLLVALGGGGVAAERTRAAAAVASVEGVGGYALCGLGTGEDPALRPVLISASLGALPPPALERKPVFAPGLSTSPEDILTAVGEGVDLLDCALVAQVTAGGYALTFPLRPAPGLQGGGSSADAAGAGRGGGGVDDPSADSTSASASVPVSGAPGGSWGWSGEPGGGLGPDVSIGADDTKINLWSTSYRRDRGPLLPGCGCFACRRHSRAYVHHLVNTHEMLGDVLLEAHNTSHVNAFCQAIREAISEGRFQEYCNWFRRLRAVPLVPPPRRVAAKRRASESTLGAEVAAATVEEDFDTDRAKWSSEGGSGDLRPKWELL